MYVIASTAVPVGIGGVRPQRRVADVARRAVRRNATGGIARGLAVARAGRTSVLSRRGSGVGSTPRGRVGRCVGRVQSGGRPRRAHEQPERRGESQETAAKKGPREHANAWSEQGLDPERRCGTDVRVPFLDEEVCGLVGRAPRSNRSHPGHLLCLSHTQSRAGMQVATRERGPGRCSRRSDPSRPWRRSHGPPLLDDDRGCSRDGTAPGMRRRLERGRFRGQHARRVGRRRCRLRLGVRLLGCWLRFRLELRLRLELGRLALGPRWRHGHPRRRRRGLHR